MSAWLQGACLALLAPQRLTLFHRHAERDRPYCFPPSLAASCRSPSPALQNFVHDPIPASWCRVWARHSKHRCPCACPLAPCESRGRRGGRAPGLALTPTTRHLRLLGGSEGGNRPIAGGGSSGAGVTGSSDTSSCVTGPAKSSGAGHPGGRRCPAPSWWAWGSSPSGIAPVPCYGRWCGTHVRSVGVQPWSYLSAHGILASPTRSE